MIRTSTPALIRSGDHPQHRIVGDLRIVDQQLACARRLMKLREPLRARSPG